MKLAELKEALASRADLADWRISETRRKGAECYLIGDRPDLGRSIEARDCQVTVYVDQGGGETRSRGSASAAVHPTMGGRELAALLDRAAFAASKSRNPWYPIPGPAPASFAPPASGFEGRAPEAWSAELLAALYRAEGRAGAARVNSLELFLTRSERRVLNSRGVDAAWTSWSGTVELTVEAEGSAGEVELTDWLRFSEPDLARLEAEMAGRLEAVRDRAAAAPLPALAGLPLVLAESEAEAILRWFFGNLDAARAYSKASPLVLGQSLHGAEAREGEYDRLDIRAEPGLPGAPASAPYDAEGFPLASLGCAEGGVARAFHGAPRYAHYLGLPPAGAHALFSVGPGSIPAAELRSAPGLEVAYFSDFDVDLDSGDFGGEIRLAYWNDGSRRIPVTGGSVTGSLFENRGLLRLSRETALAETMRGPEAILLPRVSVTAAK